MKQKQPVMTIFCGINGAGKSTLYSFLKHIGEPNLGVRICPDEILLDFNGCWKSSRDVARSGTLTVHKIQECIDNNISFNWETTLIGTSSLNYVMQAKEKGFKIHLNFIGVENVDLALRRIRERVLHGGHGVPEAMVRMRHSHQFLNMDKLFTLIDTAMFYDNSECMEIVGTYKDQKLNIYGHRVSWVNGLQESHQLSKESNNSSQKDEELNKNNDNDNTISGM